MNAVNLGKSGKSGRQNKASNSVVVDSQTNTNRHNKTKQPGTDESISEEEEQGDIQIWTKRFQNRPKKNYKIN